MKFLEAKQLLYADKIIKDELGQYKIANNLTYFKPMYQIYWRIYVAPLDMLTCDDTEGFELVDETLDPTPEEIDKFINKK